MTAMPERHIPIEGTHNFRDAGGYATRDGRSIRWRTLFRSDSHDRLTVKGSRAIEELGIRTSIDLRAEHEVQISPSLLASAGNVAYRQLPLRAEGSDTRAPRARDLEELNRNFFDTGYESFATILAAIAENGTFPVVVNCAVGKDRTGLLIALLLELAGVSREDVVADYALTAEHAGERIAEVAEVALKDGRDPAQFARLMECKPETMAESLAYLDSRYGGAEQYVQSIGLSPESIAAIREALLEK